MLPVRRACADRGESHAPDIRRSGAVERANGASDSSLATPDPSTLRIRASSARRCGAIAACTHRRDDSARRRRTAFPAARTSYRVARSPLIHPHAHADLRAGTPGPCGLVGAVLRAAHQ
jgi:hypothetical protein